MTTVDVVHGLLPEGDELDATVADLEGHGIYPSEIEVVEPEPGRYELADETLHRDVLGTRRGAAIGAVLGLVVGLAIGFAVPGIADGGAEVLLTAAVAVAGFGALIGAMVGLQRRERNDDDPVRWRQVADDDPLCCLTVRCVHRTTIAHRVMERHGAEFLESDQPAQPADQAPTSA